MAAVLEKVEQVTLGDEASEMSGRTRNVGPVSLSCGLGCLLPAREEVILEGLG